MTPVLKYLFLVVFIPFSLLAESKKTSPYNAELKAENDALIATLVARKSPRFAKQSLLNPFRLKLEAGRHVYNIRFDKIEPALWRSYFNNGITKEEDRPS